MFPVPEEDEKYFAPENWNQVFFKKYGTKVDYFVVYPYPIAYLPEFTGNNTRMYTLHVTIYVFLYMLLYCKITILYYSSC